MKRGDVYWADLGEAYGCEQDGNRPVVIIQNNKGNEFSRTLIVAPMTSSRKKFMLTHVRVGEGAIGMDPNSLVLAEQIRTIDKRRIGNYICKLDTKTMNKVDDAIKISLGLSGCNKEERTEKKDTSLMTFRNEEIGARVRAVLNDDGSISVSAEDAAIGFGWTQEKEGKTYVKWERLNTYCQSLGYSPVVGKDDYIPEGLFYRLGMKASNSMADRFQNWLAMEVIPSIRRTGGYHQKTLTPEEMMRIQLGMIDAHEARIANIESSMNINNSQQRALEKEVADAVIKILGGKDSSTYQDLHLKVFSDINKKLKDQFHVNSRNDIPRMKFDAAVEFIRDWKPEGDMKDTIDAHILYDTICSEKGA